MKIYDLIEIKRKEMLELGILFGLSSEKTVICSQELDLLLNQTLSSDDTSPLRISKT